MLVDSRFFLNQIINDKDSRMRYKSKNNTNTAVIKQIHGNNIQNKEPQWISNKRVLPKLNEAKCDWDFWIYLSNL